MTLSGATIPGQNEPGSDGNEEVIRISQSSSITGTSPSACFVSYPGHLVFFTPLQKCSWCILQPQPTVGDLKMVQVFVSEIHYIISSYQETVS